jgi:c(7)-type cytochrome triheme protein
MKSRSRTGCIIGMALSVCLGLCFSAAGQAEKPDQNAPPPMLRAEAPLPPELQKLKKAETQRLPLELQQLQEKNLKLPPELQQMAKKESAPPSLPIPKKLPPEAEKPAAAQAKVITDPAAMPTADISLFSHTFHVEKAGFKCTDCHNSIFQEIAGSAKAKGDFNMAAFGQGKYCGTCHDGSTAFAVTEQGSCVRCHGTDMELPQSK